MRPKSHRLSEATTAALSDLAQTNQALGRARAELSAAVAHRRACEAEVRRLTAEREALSDRPPPSVSPS